MAHHRHIALDALALTVGTKFSELQRVAGLAVVGVAFTCQTSIIAHLAGGCSGRPQQVEPVLAHTGGAHFLEIGYRPAGQAVDGGS